jgi:hypothetical protein
MVDLLLVAGVVTLVWMALGIAVLHRLRRRNAVGHRSGCRAPLWWLLSPGILARLHRRLGRAVDAVRLAVPAPRRRAPRSAFHDVADDLEREALTIDAELVALRRLPLVHRYDAQRDAFSRVTELERLAARIVSTMSVRDGRDEPAAALDALGNRIDALQHALDELAQIERVAGLRAG